MQVMSGRSESNSLFESNTGRRQLTRLKDDALLPAEQAYQELLETDGAEIARQIVEETRENYIRHFIELLNLIKVPKVLSWFSERSLCYPESYEDVRRLFGKFPQLVNGEMIERIKPFAGHYVECVSDDGMPQPLISWFTGRPAGKVKSILLGVNEKKYNTYYPSPGMHQAAFTTLLSFSSNHKI